jgi:hypothetical protein
MLDTGTRAFQIRTLSGVAGHLASALDVLSLSGCDWFLADILEMLAVIDGQIALLEELGNEGSSSTLGAT